MNDAPDIVQRLRVSSNSGEACKVLVLEAADEIYRLRAAIAQTTPQAAPTVPEGMALVPVEPTPEMLAAMQSSGWLPGCYRAMLAAAPQEPQR